MRRTRWTSCLSIISLISPMLAASGITTQNVEAMSQRRQRIAQFMRQGREKFVLATIGLLQRLGLGL